MTCVSRLKEPHRSHQLQYIFQLHMQLHLKRIWIQATKQTSYSTHPRAFFGRTTSSAQPCCKLYPERHLWLSCNQRISVVLAWPDPKVKCRSGHTMQLFLPPCQGVVPSTVAHILDRQTTQPASQYVLCKMADPLSIAWSTCETKL